MEHNPCFFLGVMGNGWEIKALQKYLKCVCGGHDGTVLLADLGTEQHRNKGIPGKPCALLERDSCLLCALAAA